MKEKESRAAFLECLLKSLPSLMDKKTLEKIRTLPKKKISNLWTLSLL